VISGGCLVFYLPGGPSGLGSACCEAEVLRVPFYPPVSGLPRLQATVLSQRERERERQTVRV